MTRSKSLFSKIIAPVAALVLSLGIAAGAGVGLTANAAELQEDLPESGWYVVGNGAGYLKDCSWQAYLANWRLTGTAEDEENYAGIWQTNEILLYQGDQFKIVYNDGTWTHPDESGWTEDNCAQFANIVGDTAGYFSDGGLGNIYAEVSGYYTFTLNVEFDAETGLSTLTLSFVRSDRVVPPRTLYDMYIVGSIASVETCGWPDALRDEGKTVEDSCIPMTSATEGEGEEQVTTWSATVVLGLEDQFKLYNTVTGTYYPGGFDNNLVVTEAGTYLVSWVEGSQEVTLTPQTPVEG